MMVPVAVLAVLKDRVGNDAAHLGRNQQRLLSKVRAPHGLILKVRRHELAAIRVMELVDRTPVIPMQPGPIRNKRKQKSLRGVEHASPHETGARSASEG